MTALSTNPPSFQMASTETLPLGQDFGPLLEEGESITALSVTLTDMRTGAARPASLSGEPELSGTVCTQVVTALKPGDTYRLSATGVVLAGVREWTIETLLVCLF